MDAPAGVLGIEWIDGRSVRFLLGSGDEGVEEEEYEEGDEEMVADVQVDEEDPLKEYGVAQGKQHYRDLSARQW